MYGRTFTVDPRSIAHCKICYEPMYYIYDPKLRSICHECMMEHNLQEGLAYDYIVQGDHLAQGDHHIQGTEGIY